MKSTLVLVVVLLSLGSGLYGQTNQVGKIIVGDPKDSPKAVTFQDILMPTGTNGPAPLSDRMIRELAESGEICRLFGHWWESIPHLTLEYLPDGNYPQHRKCHLCGKVETRTEVWK